MTVRVKGRVRAACLSFAGRISPVLPRASALANLGSSRVAAAKIFGSVLVLELVERFKKDLLRPLRLDIRRPVGQLSVWVDSVYDLEVLRELFLWGEYDGELGSAECVVDAGSNIGLAALDFALRCPEARVIAIEPNPQVFRKLVRNTRLWTACYSAWARRESIS
jgi:hypothetical protein